MKELFLNSLSVTIYKTLSAAIKFGLIILITNLFGAANYGAYTFALSVFLFINTIFRFGFDVHIQKATVDIFNNNGDDGRFLAQKNLIKTIAIVISFLFFVSLILKYILGFNWLEGLKFEYLNYMIPYSIFYAGMWLFAYYFRGRDKGKTSVFVLEIFFPILNILLILLFKLFNDEPSFILTNSYGFSVIITLIIFLFLEKLNFNLLTKSKIFNQSIYVDIKSALPFLLISVSSMLMAWVDFYIISFFETDTQLGIYSVSTRLALFMLFPASAISIFFSNKLVLFYKKNEQGEIKRYLMKITLALFALSFTSFIIINLFSHQILSLFGKEFTSGNLVLLMLTGGYMLSATMGGFDTVILMSNLKSYLFKLNFLAIIVNTVCNIPLVYYFGIFGAAVGTVFAILVNKLLQYIIIKKYLLTTNKVIQN